MSVVGGLPESGVRVDIARPEEGGPPWRYEGEVMTAGERFAISAEISNEGDVVVGVPPDAPREIADRVRLIVRAAHKQARDDDRPPPRRLARWRAET